jgi:hypothetical protein
MDSGRLLQLGLWIAPVVLQLLIAAAMIERGLIARFSFFFVYCLYTPARDIVLFFLQHRANLYAWVYWLGEGISIALQLLILCQVVWFLVHPCPGFRKLAERILKGGALVSVGIACVLFSTATAGGGKPIFDTILLMERSARLVQVVLLILAMALISRFGLTRNHYASGIIVGCGVAGLQLVPFELRAGLHAISDSVFIWLMPALYDCAVLIWGVSFLSRSRSEGDSIDAARVELRGWDEMLKRYLSRT